jgi:hypothetical protein
MATCSKVKVFFELRDSKAIGLESPPPRRAENDKRKRRDMVERVSEPSKSKNCGPGRQKGSYTFLKDTPMSQTSSISRALTTTSRYSNDAGTWYLDITPKDLHTLEPPGQPGPVEDTFCFEV